MISEDEPGFHPSTFLQKKVNVCVFPYSDERLLEVQQLCFGLSEIPEVTTQLKHPEHQHQRRVLTEETRLRHRTG